MTTELIISSVQNPLVKETVRLRDRRARDERQLLLIEGYRELRRALDAGHPIQTLLYCRDLFLGANEDALLADAAARGARRVACTAAVFRKVAYRDRPDGLLGIAPQVRRALADLALPAAPLILVAESIEKPGNLGTMLRSADATGVDAVLVCDRTTDIFNPNVVRASIGTLFTRPVVECAADEGLAWLRARGVRIVAASPHATRRYTAADLRPATAIVVGSEQYGLASRWLDQADEQVAIPMRGAADSLNVAAAATILLYEALRQRAAP